MQFPQRSLLEQRLKRLLNASASKEFRLSLGFTYCRLQVLSQPLDSERISGLVLGKFRLETLGQFEVFRNLTLNYSHKTFMLKSTWPVCGRTFELPIPEAPALIFFVIARLRRLGSPLWADGSLSSLGFFFEERERERERSSRKRDLLGIVLNGLQHAEHTGQSTVVDYHR